MAATSDNNEEKNFEKTSDISPVEEGMALYLVYTIIYSSFCYEMEIIVI